MEGRVPAEIVCPTCGFKAKFMYGKCPYCGTNLDQDLIEKLKNAEYFLEEIEGWFKTGIVDQKAYETLKSSYNRKITLLKNKISPPKPKEEIEEAPEEEPLPLIKDLEVIPEKEEEVVLEESKVEEEPEKIQPEEAEEAPSLKLPDKEFEIGEKDLGEEEKVEVKEEFKPSLRGERKIDKKRRGRIAKTLGRSRGEIDVIERESTWSRFLKPSYTKTVFGS